MDKAKDTRFSETKYTLDFCIFPGFWTVNSLHLNSIHVLK